MTTPPVEEKAKPKPILLRLLFSGAWGTLLIAVGAVTWGVISYFSNSISFFVAFLIGLTVASATLIPLRPIHKALALCVFPVVAIGTLLGILLGEIFFHVLILMRDSQAAFPDAFVRAAGQLGQILSEKDTATSAILGLIGAAVSFYLTWKDL